MEAFYIEDDARLSSESGERAVDAGTADGRPGRARDGDGVLRGGDGRDAVSAPSGLRPAPDVAGRCEHSEPKLKGGSSAGGAAFGQHSNFMIPR